MKDNKGKYITRKNMVFLYGDKPYEKLLNSMFIQAKLDIMHFEKALLKPLKKKENHTFSKGTVEQYFSACRLLGYKPPFKFQKKWSDFSNFVRGHYVWEVIQ